MQHRHLARGHDGDDRRLVLFLGNTFGKYVVTLPTGSMPALTRLARTHDQVEELKGSPEAVVAYFTLVAMGWLPDRLADLSTRLFTAKIAAPSPTSPAPGPR